MTIERQPDSLVTSVGASAPYKAAVTVFVIAAGVLASLYAADILKARHFYFGKGTISWQAMSFWITVVLAAILFFVGQEASDTKRKHSEEWLNAQANQFGTLISTLVTFQHNSDSRRKEAEERLDQRSRELAGLVRELRTLPPADFLSELGSTFRICKKIVATVQGDTGAIDASKVRAAIREVLESLASLAHKFDAAPPTAYYAANIMRFRPAGAISAEERREMKEKDRLFFCEPTTDIGQLDGVLELDRELSARVGDKGEHGPEPEDWLTPLTLPVPQEKDAQRGGRWRVLPGAPMAFVKARRLPGEPVFDAYADTESLAEFCRDQKEFSETVVKQIEDYYSSGEAGRRVKSFVCFALEGSPPMGVVNIHADATGILRQDIEGAGERSLKLATKQFAYLVEPLFSIVLDLMRVLDR